MRRFVRLLTFLTALGCTNLVSPFAHAGESRYILAVSWQPAFCETAPGRPECRGQNEGRPDARQFSLHELWPQPLGKSYCGVDRTAIDKDKAGKWRDIDMERLPDELWRRLRVVMPGTASHLERHEWLKHGTCMPRVDPATYFEASLALVDALNASPVKDLFAGSIGGSLSDTEIRNAFDEAFGAGAGRRVRIACDRDGDRRLIVEFTIGLSGDIGQAPDLAALIAAAPETDPGCPGGIVDPAGLQ